MNFFILPNELRRIIFSYFSIGNKDLYFPLIDYYEGIEILNDGVSNEFDVEIFKDYNKNYKFERGWRAENSKGVSALLLISRIETYVDWYRRGTKIRDISDSYLTHWNNALITAEKIKSIPSVVVLFY